MKWKNYINVSRKRNTLYLIFHHELMVIIPLILLSLILCTVNLYKIPVSIRGDELGTAIQSISILKGDLGLIGAGWFYQPLLSFFPHAVSMAIFGQNIVGNRLGSVFFGVITIPFYYLFVKNLFTKKIALFSTFLLLSSHLWIALSRLGIVYVQATFFIVISLYFFVEALKSEKRSKYILSGVFSGLALYSYFSVRILPVLISLLVILNLSKGFNKKKIFNLLFYLMTSLIVFSPQGIFFLQNPQTFFNRMNTVFIFSNQNRNVLRNSPQILLSQSVKAINVFKGDNSYQYGYKGQLLDYFTIMFFFIGVICSLFNLSKKNLFILLWLCAALLAQILTISPQPFFLPRFVVGLPPLFILVAIGLTSTVNFFGRNIFLRQFLQVCFLLLILIFNIYVYFIKYPTQTFYANSSAASKLSIYLSSLSEKSTVILLGPKESGVGFKYFNFFLPGINTISIDSASSFKQIEKEGINKKWKNIEFIIYYKNKKILDKIRSVYPSGKILIFNDRDGKVQFYVYEACIDTKY